MNARFKFRSVKVRLTAAVACAIGLTIASAAPPEATPKATTAKAAATKTIAATATKSVIDPSRLQLEAPRKPLTPDPYTIDDVRKMWKDDKLTPDSKVTLQNKKQIAVKDYLDQLNKVQSWMNAHGYDLKDPAFPKTGLRMRLAGKGTQPQLAQQRAKIAAQHKAKGAGKTNIAEPTRDQVAAGQETAKKFDAWRKQEIGTRLKGIDQNKLSPQEKQSVKAMTSGNLTLTGPARAALLNGSLNQFVFGNQSDYHKGWNWSFGSADLAEVDVVGDLRLSSTVTLAGGIESLHARGTLDADCFVLDGSKTSPHKIVELVTDFSSSSAGDVLQASAKVFGQDLFTPINETKKQGDFINKTSDHPFEVTITQGDAVLFGIPVHYQVDAKGDLQYTIVGTAAPGGLNIHPTAKLTSSLVAAGGVGIEIASLDIQGTVNLVSDTLDLKGSVGVQQTGTAPPILDTQASAHDTLKLLGGEIDLVLKIDLGFFTKDLGTTKLFELPDFTPVDGFVFGPDDIKKPLQQQAKAPAAEAKKKN